jgi:hypothetical protein
VRQLNSIFKLKNKMNMYKIKFIKNPPTVENLKSLYESEMYQNLLNEFAERSEQKLDNREYSNDKINILLNRAQKRYLILNIPFEEVLSEFENSKDEFLNYQITVTDFFTKKEDKNPDGEFPKGEKPEKDDKSEVIEVFGLSKTFLIDKFCEFYLLKIGDNERLLHFLNTTRMPFAKKYTGQITKLYKQATQPHF